MGGVFHISEEEAARDFSALLGRVRAGEQAVVDGPDQQVMMRSCGSSDAATPTRYVQGKTADQILAAFAVREANPGPILTDPGFADDLAKAHASLNQPLDDAQWV